jgi:amino-acid N-acetyltransferase
MTTAIQVRRLRVLEAAVAPAAARILTHRDVARGSAVTVRTATPADADEIHRLIVANLAAGRLLPRDRSEIAVHADRFIVVVNGSGNSVVNGSVNGVVNDGVNGVAEGADVIACAELAPLSRTVAEVRSLVVSPAARSLGLGRELVDELVRRAAAAGFDKLCAFTHAAGYFVQMGFSIVPHAWLPEKIETDCRTCSLFRHCGQYAVMLRLAGVQQTFVPLASLHG